MKIIGRLGALLLGVLGFIVGFVLNIVHSTVHSVFQLGATHGFVAFLFLVVGLVGSLIALFAPRTAALLLLISAIGFIIFVGLLYGIVPAVILLIAAILAFIDQGRVTA